MDNLRGLVGNRYEEGGSKELGEVDICWDTLGFTNSEDEDDSQGVAEKKKAGDQTGNAHDSGREANVEDGGIHHVQGETGEAAESSTENGPSEDRDTSDSGKAESDLAAETLVEMAFGTQVIRLFQRKGLGIGHQVWMASLCLCKYLDENKERYDFKGKKVLEIGAGAGAAGLACALLGAYTVLTDKADVIPTMQRNIDANNLTSEMASAQDLTWGETDVSAFKEKSFDYIVAADVVYHEYLFDLLYQTMNELTQGSMENVQIIWAHEWRRRNVEKRFFKKLFKFFDVETIEPELPEYIKKGKINIFLMKRKKSAK